MLENLSGETRLFPILGDPVKHAKSPHRLTLGFESRGQNAICVPLLVHDGALKPVMHSLALIPNVAGLLVTMPHKFTVFEFCATTTTRTKLLGAVSVTRRNSDGSWHGDTMDGAAFVKGSKTPALTLKERERFWWARARRAARLLWRCYSSSTTPVPGASIN